MIILNLLAHWGKRQLNEINPDKFLKYGFDYIYFSVLHYYYFTTGRITGKRPWICDCDNAVHLYVHLSGKDGEFFNSAVELGVGKSI